MAFNFWVFWQSIKPKSFGWRWLRQAGAVRHGACLFIGATIFFAFIFLLTL
jgi:hypothetical protein